MTLKQAYSTLILRANRRQRGAIVGGDRLAFNQVVIITDNRLPSSWAATTVSVVSLFALPTTLAIGWLVDRYPVHYVVLAPVCAALRGAADGWR
jgi:hypothetical protein